MESINSDKIVLIGQKYPIQWRRTGNLLQYSCPGDTMEREAWWATAHGIPRVDIFHLLPSNLPSHFRPAYLHKFTSKRLWSEKSSTLISLLAISKQMRPSREARRECPSSYLAPSLPLYPSDCLRAWTSRLRISLASIHWALHLPYLTESSRQHLWQKAKN